MSGRNPGFSLDCALNKRLIFVLNSGKLQGNSSAKNFVTRNIEIPGVNGAKIIVGRGVNNCKYPLLTSVPITSNFAKFLTQKLKSAT